MLAAPIGTVNHTNRPPAPGTYKASKHLQVLRTKEDETPANKTAYARAIIARYSALDTRVVFSFNIVEVQHYHPLARAKTSGSIPIIRCGQGIDLPGLILCLYYVK